MLQWNEKCDQPGGDPSKKLTTDQMLGNQFFFFGAGTDTSRATSTSLLYFLGEDKEITNMIYKDITENILEGKVKDFVKNPNM